VSSGLTGWARWALIAWIAVANGLDVVWTVRASEMGVPEMNPLLAGIVDSAWLLVAKLAAVGFLCLVNVAVDRVGGQPARMFTAGLLVASVWYAGVVLWHIAHR
jgi:hypothetical protein